MPHAPTPAVDQRRWNNAHSSYISTVRDTASTVRKGVRRLAAHHPYDLPIWTSLLWELFNWLAYEIEINSPPRWIMFARTW